MRRIYEDILDDIEQVKRPDITTEEVWVPSPGAYEHCACCHIHEWDLNAVKYKLPYFLDIYAEDYSYYFAEGIQEQRRVLGYIKNLDIAMSDLGALLILEYTADEKKLPYLLFYIFGLTKNTLYYLFPDERNASGYKCWPNMNNFGSGDYARNIMNGRYVMPDYRRVLYTQITGFVTKFDFTSKGASERWKRAEQRACDVVEQLFQRSENMKAKKEGI